MTSRCAVERDVFDVAVVGFGPTGAVAAGAARRPGLRVWVVRPRRARSTTSRAPSRSTTRSCACSSSSAWSTTSCRTSSRSRRRSSIGVDGQLIKRLTMVEPPYPLGYTPSMVFTQPPVERALRAHVAGAAERHGGTRRRRGRADAGRRRRRRCGCATATARRTRSARATSIGLRRRVEHRARGLRHRAGRPGVRRALAGGRRAGQRRAAWPSCRRPACSTASRSVPARWSIGPGNHRRWEISLKRGRRPAAGPRRPSGPGSCCRAG